MKIIFFLFITFLSINGIKAQDLITRTDSSKVSAAIAEIGPTQVKYKLFNYPDGPMITANRLEIAYIVFKNGTVEQFPKAVVVIPGYDPNRYNLDKVPVSADDPEQRIKKREALYAHKNYVGFNYVSLLNTSFGFNYMRDVKKAHMIIHVPFAVGFGTPAVANALYGGDYDHNKTIRYEKMNYQVGLSPLFSPSMKFPMNFLIGPSYNFTEYRVSVTTRAPRTGVESVNSFKVYRSHYGITLGFLARITERFNTTLLFTTGARDDSYSQHDPYGVEAAKINSNTTVELPRVNVTSSYVGIMWSMGYRF